MLYNMYIGLHTAKPTYSASGPSIYKMEGEGMKKNLRNCLVHRLVRSITVRRTSGLGM